MAFERIVALNVVDDAAYTAYRRLMTPLLHVHGGSFRYDFVVGETLASDALHPVNRVFVMRFADRKGCEGFFGDPKYKEIRKGWFEKSVKGVTVVGEFEK